MKNTNEHKTPQANIALIGDVPLQHIRMIIRASDVHSRKLLRATGFTTTQALVLRAIEHLGEVTTGKISGAVHLSQATVTTVLDRLERHGFVERYRSASDRRVVHARLTPSGKEATKRLPLLMDERFVERFGQLPLDRQNEISSALYDVAELMNADATDAAPAVNGHA